MSRDAIFEASVGYFLTPIRAFLEDDTVTEIMVNRFNEIYIERRGRLERTDASFPSHDALLSAVHNVAQFVNREISHGLTEGLLFSTKVDRRNQAGDPRTTSDTRRYFAAATCGL